MVAGRKANRIYQVACFLCRRISDDQSRQWLSDSIAQGHPGAWTVTVSPRWRAAAGGICKQRPAVPITVVGISHWRADAGEHRVAGNLSARLDEMGALAGWSDDPVCDLPRPARRANREQRASGRFVAGLVGGGRTEKVGTLAESDL